MGAWIEIASPANSLTSPVSHPTMGAWIEILPTTNQIVGDTVAPHDGCVD